MAQEVFEYEIKFDYDNGPDRKFIKRLAANDEADINAGLEMIIGKLFSNGIVTGQNLRGIESIPEVDDERLSFGKIISKVDKFVKS